MEIFTNREIAVLFWVSVGAVYVLSKPAIRKAVVAVLRALLSRHLTPIYATTAAYIALIVYGLALIGAWDVSHLKTTLIWAFFVAVVEVFRMPTKAGEFIKFRQLFFDQLKVLVVVEYLVGYTAFPLIVELALFPALTALVLKQAVSEGKEDLRPAYNLLTAVLAIIVLVYLWFAFRQIRADWQSFASIATLADFALPLVLTVLFLPYLFCLSLYAIYQTAFSTLKIFITDPDIRRFAHATAITTFGANVELLQRWRRDMVISKPKSKDGVRALTREVLRRRQNENTRRYFAPGEGWDPYVAKAFLSEFGAETDEYHRFAETSDEWCATAVIKEPADRFTANHISYHVEGDEGVAKTLKLDISVFDMEDVDATLKTFLAFANTLTEKAAGVPLSDALIENIVARRDYAEETGDYLATIKTYEYIEAVGGFEIYYALSQCP